MRSAVVTALIAAAAVLAVAIYAAVRGDDLAFTPGVAPGVAIAQLAPGDEICQRPLTVPPDAEFDRVALTLGAPEPVRVTVRDARTGRVVRSARATGGRPAATGVVPAGARIALCVENAGTRPVPVYGNPGQAARATTAAVNGREIPFDVAMRFERAPRSLASLAPAMARRAALFRPGWVGAWTIWALAGLVALAVPALLVRAVRTAAE